VPFETGLGPNGICFSPDYTKVYLVRGGTLWVGDVRGGKVSGLRQYTDCMIDGIRCGPDGMRCDSAGNIWAGSAAVLGYAGVTVWNPAGKAIGRIRLPEGCANLCFAGPKRDWLFMTATQSIYMFRTNIQGAAPG
jgi:gluconolactonase